MGTEPLSINCREAERDRGELPQYVPASPQTAAWWVVLAAPMVAQPRRPNAVRGRASGRRSAACRARRACDARALPPRVRAQGGRETTIAACQSSVLQCQGACLAGLYGRLRRITY